MIVESWVGFGIEEVGQWRVPGKCLCVFMRRTPGWEKVVARAWVSSRWECNGVHVAKLEEDSGSARMVEMWNCPLWSWVWQLCLIIAISEGRLVKVVDHVLNGQIWLGGPNGCFLCNAGTISWSIIKNYLEDKLKLWMCVIDNEIPWWNGY